MFKNFSTHFLGNSELITILIILLITVFSALFMYKKLPKHDISTKKHSSDLFRKLQTKDIFWICLLSFLYAIVSLWNLGSMTTIDSFWQPVSEHEEILLELNESHFDGILWVSGEGNNNECLNGYQNQVDFQIQGSNDLMSWFDVGELNTIDYLKVQMTEGQWDYRYIKIISRNINNVLNEIGFRKTGTNDLIKASFLSMRVLVYQF